MESALLVAAQAPFVAQINSRHITQFNVLVPVGEALPG
jgi:hypothetical protein